ncbi:MAG: hypothetical protein PVF47_07695 [Anaerolineae bacterium]|jgi:hypothetical protein
MIPSRWPKWALFFVALGLVVATIVVGLLLEPIGLALAPTVTPEASLPAIDYAQPISGECENCHFDSEALAASAEPGADLEATLIDPASLETVHGSLGCITCHGGTGEMADKDAAHEGLVEDLDQSHPEDCLLCHRNLPSELPEDNLRTPHGEINNAVWQGSPCGVMCSECHGAIGHGPDPVTGANICPMTVCQDCHESRNLGEQLTECNACHNEQHDVADTDYVCSGCHTSTETWQETSLTEEEVEHPVALVGDHARLDCFSCHRWPNFTTLDLSCSGCHERDHEQGNDDCALCHTPEDWVGTATAKIDQAAASPHPVELEQQCADCHGQAEAYASPEDHQGLAESDCQVCHPSEAIPAIMHPVEERDACRDCHDLWGVAPYPYDEHQAYEESACRSCHVPTDAEARAVPHSLENRADCLLCHGPVRIKPYPTSHLDWSTEGCLLCHESAEKPTPTEHLFPMDHNGVAENCETCHDDRGFQDYTCEACHKQEMVETIHLDRGVKLEEDCMICHPEGKNPIEND